jgi:hypothetical protein
VSILEWVAGAIRVLEGVHPLPGSFEDLAGSVVVASFGVV